jgi:hypothetical protein
MSHAFDYNGVVVAPSAPKKVLRTVKKTIHLDSADRDTSKFFTNGDWVAYLPRNYQNVTKIHLKSAEFPPLMPINGAVAYIASITFNDPTVTFTVGSTVGITPGSTVVVASATAAGNNGRFTVATVPNATTFTISNASGVAQGSAAGTVTVLTSAAGAVSHLYSEGANVTGARYSNDIPVTTPAYYFTIELAGLNKTDETVVGGNKSTLTDNFFAKIPAMTQTYGSTSFIEYNESANHDTTAVFSPPIENLDRLQIQTRLHSQQDNSAFIYWTSNGAPATASNRSGTADYNLTLEIEYLENAFDEFSSFETRIRQ